MGRTYHTEDGLAHGTVWAVVQDRSGFMWFGTSDGLHRFDGYNFKAFQTNADGRSISDNLVRSLLLDSKGELWVGTARGLNRFDPETGLAVRFLHRDDDPNSISGDYVAALAEDGQTVGGVTHRYGRRMAAAVIQQGLEDRYLPNQATGCRYRARDTYGLRGATQQVGLRIRLDVTWQGRVIDTRAGNRVLRTLHRRAARDDIIV